jgi:hypothetical protein
MDCQNLYFLFRLDTAGVREAELEGEFNICVADECGLIILTFDLKSQMVSGSRTQAPDSKFLQLTITVLILSNFCFAF